MGHPKRYYILFRSDYAEKGSFFSELVLSIQAEIFNEGASCSLGVIKPDYSEFLKLLKLMQAEEINGVLIVGDAPIDYLNAVLKAFGNVVFVDYPGDARLCRQCNAVVFDNVHGSYSAVRHLLGLGRKRILLLHGPHNHYFSRAMRIGYKDALDDNGLDFDPDLLVACDFQLQGGQHATERIIDSGLAFDAVFSNDIMACGSILALNARGIRVPEDVSVVGFDGLPIGEAMSPTLTTVVADRNRVGKLAVRRMRTLEDCIGEDSGFMKLSVFPELVVRQSCGGKMSDCRSKETTRDAVAASSSDKDG